MHRLLVFAIIVVALASLACAASSDEIPAEERRWHAINKTIMCPVCPGESIDQSQNDLAVQMRGIVREQIDDGWTDAQIKAFWVERYGQSVLLEPPREGFSLLVWVLPPVIVVAAGLALFYALSRMRRPAPQSGAPAQNVELSDAELSSYVKRVEAMLEPHKSETRANRDGHTPRQPQVKE